MQFIWQSFLGDHKLIITAHGLSSWYYIAFTFIFQKTRQDSFKIILYEYYNKLVWNTDILIGF